MVRRYRRRNTKKDKYSVENTLLVTPSTGDWTIFENPPGAYSRQYSIPILPPADIQGMRKVKHLTFSVSSNTAGENIPLLYAIVFVPQGYTPQNINYPASGNAISVYDANQFVMSSGILDFSGGPLRIRSRLSRNLNSGDSIYIILATPVANETSVYTSEITYAITLQ